MIKEINAAVLAIYKKNTHTHKCETHFYNRFLLLFFFPTKGLLMHEEELFNQ